MSFLDEMSDCGSFNFIKVSLKINKSTLLGDDIINSFFSDTKNIWEQTFKIAIIKVLVHALLAFMSDEHCDDIAHCNFRFIAIDYCLLQMFVSMAMDCK